MADTINQIMDRIKRLEEYEVQVTVPQNFRFTGTVPYDMTIVSDQAFVKIVAESFDSALFKVRDFFGIEDV